jgi:hypothetical protein
MGGGSTCCTQLLSVRAPMRYGSRITRIAGKVAAELFYVSYSSLFYIRTQRRPYRFIFIISHMRSGSSLLTHLLTSNPAICGYGETHRRYYAEINFKALVGNVLYTLRDGPLAGNEKYVLDKVLHNHLLSPRRLRALQDERFRVIFLLREPYATLSSAVQTLHLPVAQAVDYYLKRVARLEEDALVLTPHTSCVALTYDQLLHRTEEVFRLLEEFLGLDHPLTETYQVLPTTGKARIGDPSAKIQAGRIVKDAPEAAHSEICDEDIWAARRVYKRCHALLRNTCLTVDAGESGEAGGL